MCVFSFLKGRYSNNKARGESDLYKFGLRWKLVCKPLTLIWPTFLV